MKEIWQSTNKFYLANSLIFTSVFAAIILTFLVQFKVEALQDEILKTQNQIIASEDEIQLLEVEWVYLTRPERLRQLASRYLQDNGYVLASQIKDSSKLEKYYLVSYKKYENSIQSKIDEQLALDDGENVDQVSF
jgi:hypothetical protein